MNSVSDISFGCMDKGYAIGDLIEWKINGVIFPCNSNTKNEPCLNLNWSDVSNVRGPFKPTLNYPLKTGQENRVVCQHSYQSPIRQEISAFVSKYMTKRI